MQIASINIPKSLVNFFLFNYKIYLINTLIRVFEISTTNEDTTVVMKRQEPSIAPIDM